MIFIAKHRAILIWQLRPSVFPSATLWCCVKVAKHIVKFLSPPDSTIILWPNPFTNLEQDHPNRRLSYRMGMKIARLSANK